MFLRRFPMLMAVVGVGALSACTSSQAAGPASGAASASSPSSLGVAASSAPSTVRLLTHESFVVSDQLVADLLAQTGITLEIVTAGDAGSMVAGAVLAAGAPTADVLFGIDNTLISRAVSAGVFEPYTASEIASVAPELQGDTAGGQVTPIDYGDVCVNIDDAWFAKSGITPPASLADLAKPEYKDLLVVEDPATSSPGLAFMLATQAQYGQAWTDYWTSLNANGVKVAASWTDAYMGDFTAGGGKGTRPLVVSYATSPPAEIVYAADPKPTMPSTSVMTQGCYRQVEYAGVLKGASNPEGGQQVVDWLLSEPVQADVPLSMFVFPARAGVVLPEVFTKFAPVISNPLAIDPSVVAEELPTWLADWGQVMGR
jgi:thiamine transport system substrate-binding protein